MHISWLWMSLGLSISNAKPHEESKHLPNANHIFNAIHSSMRQWGSSLNHNGMSLFIATIPQGTQLYHGTGKASRVNGTQWLAFEPEHALVFARSRKGPPPGKGGPPGPKPDEDDDEWHPPKRRPDDDEEWHVAPKKDLKARRPLSYEDLPPPLTHTAAQRERARLPSEQEPFNDRIAEEDHGYLHTYLPNRELRLLYLDGQSAAKSDKGTLDMQDVVLLQNSPPPKDGSPSGPRHARRANEKATKPSGRGGHMGGPFSEGFRAEHLCSMAAREWNGRIDGFIRMELGFELILCDFERDLDILRITQVKQSSGMGRGPKGPGHDEDSFAYYQAVASRFDGIGGERVKIDYENIVSLFAEEEAIFFNDNDLPRVRNETKTLKPILQKVTNMILREDARNEKTNWQATADMIISRYADKIAHLASGSIPDLKTFRLGIDHALRPFVDYSARDAREEIKRCATQYIAKRPNSTDLAAHAVLNVTARLCSSLSAAGEAEDLKEAVEAVRELQQWLAWTGWKKCRECQVDEVCFIPIWPLGGMEEMETPKCVKGMNETGRGYWGNLPGGSPPGGKD